jgi:hypothetical protein
MRRLRSDRGAIAVAIGLWIVVLVGLVGFAVDMASAFVERRELSRAADAAVLAIAEDCVTGSRPCDYSTALATANAYANLNADDGAAAIDALDLDLGAQRVTVTTKTIDAADGTDQFKFFFMRVLGIDSSTIRASAVAEWGYLDAGRTLPLIISDCEHDTVVGDDNTSDYVTFYFHGSDETTDCGARPYHDYDADGRLPGGFGWLATEGGCGAEIDVDDLAPADPGASPSTGCSATYFANEILGRIGLLAYFNDITGVTGSGAGGQYEIAGIGAFEVTGYNFGGQFKAPSAATAPCSGDQRCLRGRFVTITDYYGDIGGPDRGVRVVRLVG